MTVEAMPIPPVRITYQPWVIPTVRRVLEGYLEGMPTASRLREIEEDVRAKRAGWKPGKEAYELLDRLRAFVGHRVRIQFWDPIMHHDSLDEAPFPLEADCLDVVELDDGEFPQAYVVVANQGEIVTPGGFSSHKRLVVRADVPHALAPVAELYEVAMAPRPRKPGADGAP